MGNWAMEINKFDIGIDIDIIILLSRWDCTVLNNQKPGLNNSFICILLYYCSKVVTYM